MENVDIKSPLKPKQFLSIDIKSNEKEITFPEYKKLRLKATQGGIERFNFSYYSYLHNQIQDIVNIESPIHIELVMKRIAESWGFSKIGANIRKKTKLVVKSLSNEDKIFFRNDILWKDKEQILAQFRLSNEDDRPFELIPLEELGYLVIELLKVSFSIARDDLLLEVSRYLGYARRGSKIEKHLNDTVDYLLKNKLIKQEGSRMKVSGSA